MTAQDVREGRCPSWCTVENDPQHLADVACTDGPAASHMAPEGTFMPTTYPAGWQPAEPDKLTVYATVAWDLTRGPLPLVNLSRNDMTGVPLTPAEARHLAVVLIEAAATAERWE